MRPGQRWFMFGAAVLVVAAALGIVGAHPGTAAAQQAVRVEMTSGPPHFEPANITVPVGTTVTWFVSAGGHSTTSDTGLWDSGVLRGADATFSYTFSQPGTYPYHCIPHQAVGMVGTVTVTGAGAAPAAPAAPAAAPAAPKPAAPAAAPAAAPKPAAPAAAAAPAPAQAPRVLPRTGDLASVGGLALGIVGFASLAAGFAVRARRHDDRVS
jgi:LPXTG-motif cell wall-anchored protein